MQVISQVHGQGLSYNLYRDWLPSCKWSGVSQPDYLTMHAAPFSVATVGFKLEEVASSTPPTLTELPLSALSACHPWLATPVIVPFFTAPLRSQFHTLCNTGHMRQGAAWLSKHHFCPLGLSQWQIRCMIGAGYQCSCCRLMWMQKLSPAAGEPACFGQHAPDWQKLSMITAGLLARAVVRDKAETPLHPYPADAGVVVADCQSPRHRDSLGAGVLDVQLDGVPILVGAQRPAALGRGGHQACCSGRQLTLQHFSFGSSSLAGRLEYYADAAGIGSERMQMP